MARLPPRHDASVVERGPWWTEHEPSLRVPRASGGPAAIWTTGEGPDVLLVAPDTGTHDLWEPLSPWLRDRCTVHAMDRGAASFSDDVDQVATAADAVGARCLVGFADDAVVLREAAHRCLWVDRVLVLTVPGDQFAGDPRMCRPVAVSSRKIAALTRGDARRLIDAVFEEGS